MQREKPPEWREKQKGSRGIRRGQRYRLVFQFPIREPPARKTRHKMVKLKPFMDYIDMRLAENVWNSEVIFAEIKAMGYTGGRSMLRYYIQPKRKMRPSKRTRRELPVKRET
uniref:Uncharacterized protein n=1 Tax=Escherichia coli TaxID=562 RepID=A0A343J179_ECOLX|nr:hypothetical protein ECSA44_05953 [Escherichia coli]